MKNKLILSGVCLFLLNLTQCSSPEKKKENAEIKKISLIPVDTIKVKYPGTTLLLNDKRAEKLIFFDFFIRDVVITDIKGNILSKFDNADLGPDNFGKMILGVRFQSDTTIAVVSDAGYYICNLKGKVLKKYRHPVFINKPYISGEFRLGYNAKRNMFASLLGTSSELGSNVPEFYEQITHMTFFKIDSQKYLTKIKYEDESSFKQKDYYTGEWGGHFDVDRDSIAMIYGRDPIVYIYALSDFRKVRSFKTDPEYFTQSVKFKFGDVIGTDHKRRLTGFSNSTYRTIFSRGDTIMTSYNTGVPLERFENINNVEDLANTGYLYQHHYLQIFVNGKKEFPDYELPKEYPLLDIVEGRQIILTEQKKYDTKNDGYRRYLIMKIEYLDVDQKDSK